MDVNPQDSKKIYRVKWGPHRFYLPIGLKTLTAFLIIITIFSGGFLYYINHTIKENAKQAVFADLSSKLRGAWRIYAARMDQMKFGMLQAASEDNIIEKVRRRDTHYLRRLLDGYAINRPYVDLWAIVDNKRVVIARRNKKKGDMLEINGTILKALRTGQVIQSTERVEKETLALEKFALASHITDKTGLMQVVVTPIVDEGSIVGAFVTGILLDGHNWIPNTIYKHLTIDAAVFGSIFKRTKIISASTLPKSVFSPMIMLPKKIVQVITNGESFQGTVDLEGTKICIIADPILNIQHEVVGGIALGIDAMGASSIVGMLRWKLYILLLVSIIASLVISAFAYRDTSFPIKKLAAAMQDVAGGNFNVETQLKTKDEFEALSHGFNSMIEYIRVREGRIYKFNELTKLLITSLNPDLLLDAALKKMLELTGSTIGIVYMYNEENDDLVPAVSSGINKNDLSNVAMGEGIVGMCAADRKAVILKDAPDVSMHLDIGFAKIQPVSLAWFAMCYKDRLLGVFTIGSLEAYKQEDLKHMENLISQIAVALDNAILHKDVKQLSITDPLTGVYNRRYFFERLHDQFYAAKRHGYPMSLIMLDIDDFKKINDTLGHQAGDLVLREIAQLLEPRKRKSDLWARYGGEEFVGYFPYCDSEGALKVAERTRKLVEGHSFPGFRGMSITISLGVSSYPHSLVTSVDSLVKVADDNLYEAKRRGKNRVEVS